MRLGALLNRRRSVGGLRGGCGEADAKEQLARDSRQQIMARHTVDRMRSALALMQAALVKDKADLGRVEREKKSLKSRSKHRGRR